jgi:two-component system LytT family sensor kinase
MGARGKSLQPVGLCCGIDQLFRMNSWHRIGRETAARFAPEGRNTLRIQLLLVSLLSLFLYIGLPGTREWRRVAEENQMVTIIRAWDGLAWFVWVAAVPVMQALIRRYPLVDGKVRASGLRILVGSLVLYLMVTNVRYLLHVLPVIVRSPDRARLLDLDTYVFNTYGMLALDLLTYSGFFAVCFSVDYFFRYRQRVEEAMQLKMQTAQLQSDLARAELAALRGQLQPHFLFNSFNALATLVRQQRTGQAVEMIAQLSELLRLAIERTGLHEIPLRQELDFIQRYLDIERLRYGDKLQVEFDVSPAAQDALVPNIVLQPLVENAIKHAISLRTNPGWVRVKAAREGERLRITVTDDGPEKSPPHRDSRPRTGIGLANSRAQLDKLYGTDYRLQMLKRPAGGTTIHLDLPWRVAPLPEILQ